MPIEDIELRREHNRRWRKAARARALAKGLCARCTKFPQEPGSTQCSSCRAHNISRGKARRLVRAASRGPRVKATKVTRVMLSPRGLPYRRGRRLGATGDPLRIARSTWWIGESRGRS